MLERSVAYGLGFHIEMDSHTKSGMRPAIRDKGGSLFCDIRLQGWNAMLQSNLIQTLCLTGGERVLNEDLSVGGKRTGAMRDMLTQDYSAPPERIHTLTSDPNTGGNVRAIATHIQENGLSYEDCIVVSNHYHLPRAGMDLAEAGLPLLCIAAEAYLLYTNPERHAELVDIFGGGEFAARVVKEIQGMADKLRGTYQPIIR